MAKKKSTNTSKTAHVMNLLSKNLETATPAASDEASAEIRQPEPPVTAAPPAYLPSLNTDLEISTQIKSALEDSLDPEPISPAPETEVEPESSEQQETPAAESSSPVQDQESPAPEQEFPASEQAPHTQEQESPVPEQIPSASEQEPPAPEPEQEQPELEQKSTEESVPAAEPQAQAEPLMPTPAAETEEPPAESPVQTAAPEAEIPCTNIMQILVERKVDRYIKMFGLCNCPKCVADVKAIALNNLVPKYIVTPPEEESFRITIYDGRYDAEVTAQILHACKTVMENPLHD